MDAEFQTVCVGRDRLPKILCNINDQSLAEILPTGPAMKLKRADKCKIIGMEAALF